MTSVIIPELLVLAVNQAITFRSIDLTKRLRLQFFLLSIELLFSSLFLHRSTMHRFQ